MSTRALSRGVRYHFESTISLQRPTLIEAGGAATTEHQHQGLPARFHAAIAMSHSKKDHDRSCARHGASLRILTCRSALPEVPEHHCTEITRTQASRKRLICDADLICIMMKQLNCALVCFSRPGSQNFKVETKAVRYDPGRAIRPSP